MLILATAFVLIVALPSVSFHCFFPFLPCMNSSTNCRAPRPGEATSSIEPSVEDVSAEEEKVVMPDQSPSNTREKESEDVSGQKERRREECKKEKQERHEKRHFRDSDDKRKCRKDKEKRRHD